MANIIYDPGVRTISGTVGGFVHRRQKNGIWTVTKRPLRSPDWVPSAAQAAQIQRFREAVAHCKNLMEVPAVNATYRMLAARYEKRLQGLVMGDILKPPAAPTIDLSHYTGAVGETIRVLASDNVAVARLRLVVRDVTGAADLETAEKDLADNLCEFVEWLYISTAALPDPSLRHEVEIRVTAYDLAGNETSFAVTAAS